MNKTPVHSGDAPAALGPYSQAVTSGKLVFLSGQVALDPATMQLVDGNFEARVRRVFDNLAAVASAAGGTLDNAVKLTIFLTDVGQFSTVNEIMQEYFNEPYPARATVGVATLPLGTDVEVEAILAV